MTGHPVLISESPDIHRFRHQQAQLLVTPERSYLDPVDEVERKLKIGVLGTIRSLPSKAALAALQGEAGPIRHEKDSLQREHL